MSDSGRSGFRRGHALAAEVLVFLCLCLRPESVRSETFLFVGDDDFYVVWLVDVDTGETAFGLPLPPEVTANTFPKGESGLAFNGEELYYTHSSSRRVWVLDPFVGRVLRSFDKPRIGFAGLAVTDGTLFAASAVSTSRSDALIELDARDGMVIGRIDAPGALRAVTYSPGRQTLIARVGALEIREIDRETGRVVSSRPPPTTLTGLALIDRPGTLFALERNGTVYRINLEDGELLGSFQVFNNAGDPVVNAGSLAAGEFEISSIGEVMVSDPDGPAPVLDFQDVEVTAGLSTEVPVLLTSLDAETDGFVVAALSDPAVLELETVTIEGTLSAEFGAEFVAAEILPNGGSLTVTFEAEPPIENKRLPPGENLEVGIFGYRSVERDLVIERVVEVRPVDGVIGAPPKRNLIIRGTRFIAPNVNPGRITTRPLTSGPEGPAYFCGGPPDPAGEPTEVEVRSGDRTDVCFYYTFPDPEDEVIQGMSFGIVFDCRMICNEDAFSVPEKSITAAIEADFVTFHCDSDPDDGDGCEMVLGILVESLPPFDINGFPPAETPQLLACAELEVGGGVERDECLQVGYRNGVNGRFRVPVKNQVTVENESIEVTTFPCEVCVTDVGPGLFCGGPRLNDRDRPELVFGAPGETAEISFWYSSPGEAVLSLSQAIRFDCRLECIEGSFAIVDRVLEAPGVSVSLTCDNDPADGDGCELTLTVAPRDDGLPVLPPTNTPRRIATVEFRVASDAPGGRCLVLEHREVTGSDGATTSNIVTLNTGPVEAQTFDCSICTPRDRIPSFLCGGPTLDENGLPARMDDVKRGESTELCFWYTSPVDEGSDLDEIQAVSMALAYDCNLVCDESSFRVPPDSAAITAGTDFVEFNCDNDPEDGDGCEMVFALVVDVVPPIEGRTLPPTDTPLKLACVDVAPGPLAPTNSCLEVEFQDGVNGSRNVPVKNLFSVKSVSMTPETVDCEVCLARVGPEFLCGGPELGEDGLPETATGAPGEPAELCFWVRGIEDGVQGFVMSLEFDCRLTCIEDSFRVPPESIFASVEPDFVEFRCDNDPDDGDGCEIVFAALIDALPPFDGRTLPPVDRPIKLGCVDMVQPADSECGQCYAVKFVDGVNGPGDTPVRVKNLISVDNESFRVGTIDCEVCTTELAPIFIRGDCNADNMVDIADAATVISFLFGIGTWKAEPPCLDACDTNDDGRIDLADSIAILQYIFRLGVEPPAPGVETPGRDPTDDKIECVFECP